jgi:hypothetical protein
VTIDVTLIQTRLEQQTKRADVAEAAAERFSDMYDKVSTIGMSAALELMEAKTHLDGMHNAVRAWQSACLLTISSCFTVSPSDLSEAFLNVRREMDRTGEASECEDSLNTWELYLAQALQALLQAGDSGFGAAIHRHEDDELFGEDNLSLDEVMLQAARGLGPIAHSLSQMEREHALLKTASSDLDDLDEDDYPF